VRQTGEHAPYTHSLIKLSIIASIGLNDEKSNKLAEYTDFNIEARYPDEKKSFYDKCTEEFASEKFAEMEEFYTWLIKKSEE